MLGLLAVGGFSIFLLLLLLLSIPPSFFFSFRLFFSSSFHDDCYSQHDSVVPSHSPILPVQVLLCRLYTRGPSDRAHIRCRPDAAVLLLPLLLKYFSLFIFTFSPPLSHFHRLYDFHIIIFFHFQPLSPYILPLSFPSSYLSNLKINPNNKPKKRFSRKRIFPLTQYPFISFLFLY